MPAAASTADAGARAAVEDGQGRLTARTALEDGVLRASPLHGQPLHTEVSWRSAWESRPPPPPVTVPARVTSLSAGVSHALLLDDAGRVWAWGSDAAGALGLGDGAGAGVAAAASAPRLVPAFARGPRVREVSCGWAHSLAVTASHHAYAWGSALYGQCGVPCSSDVAGWEAVAGVGALPAPAAAALRDLSRTAVVTPTRLPAWDGLPLPADLAAASGHAFAGPGGPGLVAGAAGGGWHSVFGTLTGDVYTCGAGAHGQLGHAYPPVPRSGVAARAEEEEGAGAGEEGGPLTARVPVRGCIPPTLAQGCCAGMEAAPRLVERLALSAGPGGCDEEDPVTRVAAGGRHTAVSTAAGRVWVWGQAVLPVLAGEAWELQRYTPAPAEVPLGHMLRGGGAADGVAWRVAGLLCGHAHTEVAVVEGVDAI